MLSGATENVLQKLPSPFNGLLREEALFYWLFERGRTIFLSNSGGGWQIFFIYVQNYAGGWLEFHFMSKALPGGLVVQIKLFYWCGLRLQQIVHKHNVFYKTIVDIPTPLYWEAGGYSPQQMNLHIFLCSGFVSIICRRHMHVRTIYLPAQVWAAHTAKQTKMQLPITRMPRLKEPNRYTLLSLFTTNDCKLLVTV